MSETSDSSPFWWMQPEEYAEALAATAPGASGSVPAWLEEILQTAGDISPATAAEIRVAAGYGYQKYAHQGDTWAQCGARNSAKRQLAVIATRSEPDVQAARRAWTRRGGFPGPAQTRPPSQLGRSGTGQRRRHLPRAAQWAPQRGRGAVSMPRCGRDRELRDFPADQVIRGAPEPLPHCPAGLLPGRDPETDDIPEPRQAGTQP